jgi:poly-gamma-glutamate synthesis protein (capsule biosynthesis protein)
VVVSLHWGDNWGYTVPAAQRSFARRLIESGAVDVVYGHSSHHPKAIEVYEGRPILYGCGDFINDYEGIAGHEAYRPELALAYFASLDDESRRLEKLEMVTFRSRRLRLTRATREDAEWLRGVLVRECGRMGTAVELMDNCVLSLRW